MDDKWLAHKLVESDEQIQAITVIADGTIFYCTDSGLYKYDRKEKKSQDLFTSVAIFGIRGIVHMHNTLYLSNMETNCVDVFSLNTGEITKLVGSLRGHLDGWAVFRRPWGISIDLEGNIYVSDDHSIRKLLMDQQRLAMVGDNMFKGLVDGNRLGSPAGIAMNEDGIIYVCDCFGHCIRQIQNGILSTLTGSKIGSNDGSLKTARFKFPRGLALDNDDNIFVTDDNGLRILNLKQDSVTTQPGSHKCVATDPYGNVYLGAIDGIVKLDITWKRERLLWLAFLKEDALNCDLAKLPKEIVREVIGHMKMRSKKFKPKPKEVK